MNQLKVVYRSVEALIPYENNTRTHTEEQIGQVADSIREFGFTNPILVDGDNGIIAGHCRLKAAKEVGLREVPVIELAHLSDAQRRALIIADNKLAENAGWDEKKLCEEIERLLKEDGFDGETMGFSQSELDAILQSAEVVKGHTDEDEAPQTQEIAVSRPGDIWVLGSHRLMCGNATSGENVAALLGSVKPHLMVTDPPYGVSYNPEWRNDVMRADGSIVAARATGKVQNDDRADWREAWALFPGDVAYVWHGAIHSAEVFESLAAADFEIRSQIIWNKGRFVISRGHYHWGHEPCWYAVRKGRQGHWAGDRKQTTVWEVAHQKSETGHGTQKPVEVMRRPILNNSSPGQVVYEPFSGSGTTIIAAQSTGRICYAMEIDPLYVDVAVRRWQAHSLDKAKLDGTGSSFDDIARDRQIEREMSDV
uniref:Methyltransferase n=1 Tax=Candidatus Kentrum sp. LFY TaxID=2126342 RepID=A0A450WC23_9GAMM|nr:MAG: DNA modification methylase [Candidatus Kentron sp. LFY]